MTGLGGRGGEVRLEDRKAPEHSTERIWETRGSLGFLGQRTKVVESTERAALTIRKGMKTGLLSTTVRGIDISLPLTDG